MVGGDVRAIYVRFWEVFETEPVQHPLYLKMVGDLNSGRRTKASILSDLNEAAEHRKIERAQEAPGWKNENLSI